MSTFFQKAKTGFCWNRVYFFYRREDNFFFINSFTYLSLFIVFPPRPPIHYNYFPFPPPPPPHFYYFPPPTPHLYCFSSNTTITTFLLFLLHHHHHHISIIFLHNRHISLFSPKTITTFQFFLPPLPPPPHFSCFPLPPPLHLYCFPSNTTTNATFLLIPNIIIK